MNQKISIFACITLFVLYGALAATPALNFIASKNFDLGKILSLDWHNISSTNTQLIAYVGEQGDDGHHDICIARLSHGSDLDLVLRSHIPHGFANAAAWTNSGPRHLAVGGFRDSEKGLVIYNYTRTGDDSHLEEITVEDMPEVFALDWLRGTGTSYLAVGGFDDNNGREVRVYEYSDNEVLTLRSTATFFHGQANSVKWFTDISNNIFLAVAGFEIGDATNSNIRVYSFDTTTKILTLVTTKSFDFFPAYSVSWINNGTHTYLAACGYDGAGTSQTRVLSFNGSALTYVNTQGFNFGIVHASDWIFYNDTMYLAVAGDDAENGREVRVYSFDGATLTLLVSLDFGFAIPYTLEWQLVTGVPYLAIGSNDDPEALQLYSFTI